VHITKRLHKLQLQLFQILTALIAMPAVAHAPAESSLAFIGVAGLLVHTADRDKTCSRAHTGQPWAWADKRCNAGAAAVNQL
jgi:hypothetical protein